MEPKRSLYIETTIPSYATARDSGNMVNMLRKAQVNDFWDNHRYKFVLYTGQPTIDEIQDGDPDAARRRVEFMKGVEILDLTNEAEQLAHEYQKLLCIPDKAYLDCEHLAICVLGRIDYLLSLNMGHLGNDIMKKLTVYNEKHGLWTPVLVTPERMHRIIMKETEHD